jgi:hypothetical protein
MILLPVVIAKGGDEWLLAGPSIRFDFDPQRAAFGLQFGPSFHVL